MAEETWTKVYEDKLIIMYTDVNGEIKTITKRRRVDMDEAVRELEKWIIRRHKDKGIDHVILATKSGLLTRLEIDVSLETAKLIYLKMKHTEGFKDKVEIEAYISLINKGFFDGLKEAEL